MPLLYRSTLAVLATAALALACADSPSGTNEAGSGGSGGHDHGGHGGHGEDPIAAQACEDFQNGLGVPVAAALDPLAASAIAADHRRYDLSLVDLGDGNFGGVVSFEAPAAGDYVLFLDTNVGVVIEGPGGALVDVHDSHIGSGYCPIILAVSHRIPMTAGRHTLDFGPDDISSLRLVLEPSADDSPSP